MTPSTAAAVFLPPVPTGPPHDPTWFLLNARTGWRNTEISQNIDALASLSLAGAAGSGRSFGEPNGSLGGLRLPSYAATTPDCSLLLLDRKHHQIKRLDPCCCRFEVVPCLGGRGRGPRQFLWPTAIVVCASNLFVCDAANHRLSVFSLSGFALRAEWAPPASLKLSHNWKPRSLDFDSKGFVYVADSANDRVHVFGPGGRWIRAILFAGAPTLVAVDCSNTIYVRLRGESALRKLAEDQQHTVAVPGPADLAGRFAPPPVTVDIHGNLDVSCLCGEDAGTCVFDPSGNPLPPPAFKIPPPLFQTSGTFYAALDSKLYRCQWHRVILSTDIPRGSRLIVSTYTTEVDLPADQIPDFPESVWQTNQSARSGDNWDCLVRSGGGRYLWLRLQFIGNGSGTPRVSAIRVEFPRISLRRYLPAVFAQDLTASDFTDRLLAIFDTTLRSIETEIDTQAKYFDPDSTPADAPAGKIDFLSWLASWVGLKLDRGIPESRRRALVKAAGRLSPIRGTREGLHQQLLALLGMDPAHAGCCCGGPQCTCSPEPLNCRPCLPPVCAWQAPPLILEHYQLRRWLFVGSGRLGDESVLWGSRIAGRAQLDHGARTGLSRLKSTPDPLHDPFLNFAHKFTVFVPAQYVEDPTWRRALLNLLEAERPAHTSYSLEIAGPRFRIGVQSTIGLNSVVGRYPRGVKLGETPIGPASVIDSAVNRRLGPSLEVGTTRIGRTTELT
jgi:phage tail-like protein